MTQESGAPANPNEDPTISEDVGILEPNIEASADFFKDLKRNVNRKKIREEMNQVQPFRRKFEDVSREILEDLRRYRIRSNFRNKQ